MGKYGSRTAARGIALVVCGTGFEARPQTPVADESRVTSQQSNQSETRTAPGEVVTRKATTRLVSDDFASAWQLNAYFDGSGATTRVATGPDEKDSRGYGLGLGLRLAYDGPQFHFGIGAGWQRTMLNGEARPSGQGVAGEARPFVRARLLTQGGEASLLTQIHISPRIVFGPVLLGRFGTDMTYSFKAEPRSWALLGGLQIGWVRPPGSAGFGVRGGVATDLTIPRNQIWVATLGVELGIPFVGSDTEFRSEKVTKTTHREKVVVRKKTLVKVVVKDVVRADLPYDTDAFPRKATHPRPEALAPLNAFARSFTLQEGRWGTLRIEVAVRSLGSTAEDKALSEARAQSLRNAFVGAGSDAASVQAKGLGSELPTVESDGSGAARRKRGEFREKDAVSLVFADVEDEAGLEKALATLDRDLRSAVPARDPSAPKGRR